jgi:hypothetical protein
MRGMDRRIAAMETRLGMRDSEPGRYEIHFTEAGPEAGLLACSEPEHGPDCGVEAFPIGAPVRRIMVLPGPWTPIV